MANRFCCTQTLFPFTLFAPPPTHQIRPRAWRHKYKWVTVNPNTIWNSVLSEVFKTTSLSLLCSAYMLNLKFGQFEKKNPQYCLFGLSVTHLYSPSWHANENWRPRFLFSSLIFAFLSPQSRTQRFFCFFCHNWNFGRFNLSSTTWVMNQANPTRNTPDLQIAKLTYEGNWRQLKAQRNSRVH